MTISSQADIVQEKVNTTSNQEEMFSLLYQASYSNVIRTIRKTISHSITFEDIEDIASHVWMEVYQKLNSYDPAIANISTWINIIAQRRSIDFIRRNAVREKRVPQIGLGDLSPTQRVDHDNNASPAEYIVDNNAKNPEDMLPDDEYWKIISILTEMQDMPRFVAWRYYLEEKTEDHPITYSEIAELLSKIEGRPVTAKAVERSFARLRKRFRELYAEEQEGYYE